MRVGIIDFSGKKSFAKLPDVKFYLECLYDWLYEVDHRVLICSKCGIINVPCFMHSGPISAGWKKNKRTKMWVCHWCSYGGIRDLREVRNMNRKTINKIGMYKLNHPWVKWKN